MLIVTPVPLHKGEIGNVWLDFPTVRATGGQPIVSALYHYYSITELHPLQSFFFSKIHKFVNKLKTAPWVSTERMRTMFGCGRPPLGGELSPCPGWQNRKEKGLHFREVLWRYRPDLNWRMRVLQTLALPLGHGTIYKNRNAYAFLFYFVGAGDEARTRYLHLGKVALYRMSYTRMWFF